MGSNGKVAELSQLERRRSALRSRARYHFVEAEMFLRLAVSPRSLERADEPAARVRGLLDTRTGEHFVTEEERLFVGADAEVDVVAGVNTAAFLFPGRPQG